MKTEDEKTVIVPPLVDVKERKYQLDYNDKKDISGTTTLYRIVYSDSTKGGYIESEKNLSQEGYCRVLDNAQVYGSGVVKDDAILRDNSKVHSKSVVGGSAILTDEVEVMNFSVIYGNSVLSGKTTIDSTSIVQDSEVFGKIRIENSSLEYCIIKDDCSISSSKISGVTTKGVTEIKDGVNIEASANINNITNSILSGSVVIKAGINDKLDIYNSTISDNAKLYGSFSIEKSSLSGSVKIDGRNLSGRLIVSNSTLSHGTHNTNVVDLKQPKKQGLLSHLVKPFQVKKKKGLGI